MRLGVFDLLRRGFDNAVVNWQATLIRFLEAFLFMIIAIVAVIVMVMPIVVSIGINAADFDTPEDIESALGVLLQKWVLLVWILVGVTVLMIVLLLIHSFIEAGCARVFVDGDRTAGDEVNAPRGRYRVFSMNLFLTGGKEGWWPLFWIYNVIWGVGLLLILLPMTAILAAALYFGMNEGQEGLAVALSCFGMIATMLFSIVVLIVMILWTNRAIVTWAVYRTGAFATIGYAGRAIRADLLRHVGVGVAIFVIAMAASMFFASLGFFTGIGDSFGRGDVFLILTAPIRILTSLVNSAISAFIGSWFVSSYASLANNR